MFLELNQLSILMESMWSTREGEVGVGAASFGGIELGARFWVY